MSDQKIELPSVNEPATKPLPEKTDCNPKKVAKPVNGLAGPKGVTKSNGLAGPKTVVTEGPETD